MAFLEVYRGVIAGLLDALCIGLGFVIYKQASDEIDVVALNYARAGLGMLFFVMCVILMDKIDSLLALTRSIIVFLVLSVIFNVLIADTIYFRAQQLIGVSKAFPIVNIGPLFTLFFAHYLLGEPLTERLFAGVVLVISGVYLAAHQRGTHPQSSDTNETHLLPQLGIGVALAVIATLFWTFGTLCLRVGVKDTDIFVVGAVRYVAVILCMFPIYAITGDTRRIIPKNRRLLHLIAGGAVLNIMLGGIFFFTAVKELGASRSTAIISTSPLFGVGFSAILFKEHVTGKTVLGALMTVLGVWFVV